MAALASPACAGDRSAPPGAAPPAATRSEATSEREEPLSLVPRPRSIVRHNGSFTVDQATRISVDGAAVAVGEQLARWLGLPRAAIHNAGAGETGIVLQLSTADASAERDPSIEPPELAGRRSVHPGGLAHASARSRQGSAGLFYGAQTLAQLGGTRRIGRETPALVRESRVVIPAVTIEDAPRFPFRAMHLDVARHFFAKDMVERFVDLLSFYRINVFHWHLTDDQGFRLQVKAHPELTAVGGRDGFYTQEDARDVVR